MLETVEQTGRSALIEMRRLLGMLRDDGHDPLSPQPGLWRRADAGRPAARGGAPVELQVEGEPRELPVGIELSAYRIVQEALTNALKHAGGARRDRARALRRRLARAGDRRRRRSRHRRAGRGGHGLVGMRERVALYGGRFEAGRNPAGGFTVDAAATDPMTTVLIADDQALVRVGLRKILESEPDIERHRRSGRRPAGGRSRRRGCAPTSS